MSWTWNIGTSRHIIGEILLYFKHPSIYIAHQWIFLHIMHAYIHIIFYIYQNRMPTVHIGTVTSNFTCYARSSGLVNLPRVTRAVSIYEPR